MRAYWFWPYLRSEHVPLVEATAQHAGSVHVQTVEGRVRAADGSSDRVVIDATLPDVAPVEGRARWAASRALAYTARARRRQATARRFDVAHVVFLNYLVDWYSLRAMARKVPLVSSVHDPFPHEARLPARVERAALRETYRRAGRLVVHHPSIADRLVADFDVDPERITYVPHWVLPYPWAPLREAAATPTVLLFGALRANKGVAVLLDAIDALHGCDVRFVVAGRGDPALEAAVRGAARRDPRLRHEITYVDETRKHELYRECDLVVLPYTDFESQSGVLHDAYAHRRPVVAADVGALGATVREDGTGWTFRPGSGSALAEALAEALRDRDRSTRAAAACDAIAVERSVQATAARLTAVYERAVGERAPGRA